MEAVDGDGECAAVGGTAAALYASFWDGALAVYILLDLALGGVATKIVEDGYGSDYPGTLIYVAALHAFYSLITAVVNTVKFRKFQSPALSAAKAVSLTTALVSVFNLETAMLSQIGGGDEHFRLVMTACTAFSICVIVLGLAAFIVIFSTRKLRRLDL